MKNYFLLLFLFLSLFQSNDLKSFQYDRYFNRKNLAIGAGFLLASSFLYYLYTMTKKGGKNTKQPEAMLDSEIKFYDQERDAQNIKNFIESGDTSIFIESSGRNIRTCIAGLKLQDHLTFGQHVCKILFKENNIDGCVVCQKQQLREQPRTKIIEIFLLIAKSDISAERLLNNIIADNKDIVSVDAYDWRKDDDSIAWLTKNNFANPQIGYYSKKIQQ